MASAKNLYHGDLKKMGPTQIRVDSEPTKSKYPGKPDYVLMTIQGLQYRYITESPECRQFFVNQKSAVLTIEAVGDGRENNARINYLGMPGSMVGHQQPPQTYTPPPGQAPPVTSPPPPQSQQPPYTPPPPAQSHTPPTGQAPPPQNALPPRQEPPKDLGKARRFVAQNLAVATVALQAAFTKKREFEEMFKWEMPDGTFTALFTSLLYGANQNGINDTIPLDVHLTPLVTSALQQQQQTPPPAQQ